jgi:hypothetical protein
MFRHLCIAAGIRLGRSGSTANACCSGHLLLHRVPLSIRVGWRYGWSIFAAGWVLDTIDTTDGIRSCAWEFIPLWMNLARRMGMMAGEELLHSLILMIFDYLKIGRLPGKIRNVVVWRII